MSCKKSRTKIIDSILLIFVVAFAILSCFFVIKIMKERRFSINKEYDAYIVDCADYYEMPYSLVYAVIRAESRFKNDAVSNKGAMGLMQIKTETAEYVVSDLNVRRSNIKYNKQGKIDLTNSGTNIEIGVSYLKYLIDKFGSISVALAAYNAGEGNVIKWLRNEEYSNDNNELTKIPFKETSEYVEKVTRYNLKYQKNIRR